MIQVIKNEVKELVTVDESKICRDFKNKTIINKYQEKVYKFGYDKRAINKISPNHIDCTAKAQAIKNLYDQPVQKQEIKPKPV